MGLSLRHPTFARRDDLLRCGCRGGVSFTGFVVFSVITSALELGLETTLEWTARSLSLVAGFEFSMGLRFVAFVWDADSS